MKSIDKVLEKYGVGWKGDKEEKYTAFNQNVMRLMSKMRDGHLNNQEIKELPIQVFLLLFELDTGGVVVKDKEKFFGSKLQRETTDSIPNEMLENFWIQFKATTEAITVRTGYSYEMYNQNGETIDFMYMLDYEFTKEEEIKALFSKEEQEKIKRKHFITKTLLIRKELANSGSLIGLEKELRIVIEEWVEKMKQRYMPGNIKQ